MVSGSRDGGYLMQSGLSGFLECASESASMCASDA